MKMQAVRLYGAGDLRVEEIEAPDHPGEDEIIVAVEAAGICGSDLHNYRTGRWITRVPSIPGHEFCGTVAEAGARVGGLRPGDRVVADSRVFCRKCDMCRAGRPNLCRSIGYVGEVVDGGFASLVRLKEGQVLRLSDASIDPSVAAMAEPLAVALHAVSRLSGARDQPIVVAGAGPIGAITAIVLAHRGLGPLFIIERNAARAELVAGLTGAKPIALGDLAGIGCEYAVETTGSAHVLNHLATGLTPGGRIASVGIFHGRPEFDLNRIVEGEIELAGCAAFRNELPDAIGLLGRIAPSLKALAGTPIALADVPEAYAQLGAGNARSVKTIVAPSES